jgi:hypothetical protein
VTQQPKVAKGETADYNFENYTPADLAEHAPPKNYDYSGYDSPDEA